MYRAVKVVRREDFEYERTFEREFEGIQRYEQVSQDHPGLVDVLHVGRNDEAGFYYYVMELADDEAGGLEAVDPETYKAKTLSSELRRNSSREVSDCVNIGISLAGALGHLHLAGLTHRDVKPSNIIFVKGVPKLADVGLVAATGQRTFVGTEGYVPPEGPGTSSADLYSLAMVLYEMHTGKDRMDFPELPTNLEVPPTVNRDEWRSLNAVICRAGSPDPRKRYDSAHSFALALRGVIASNLPGGGRKKGGGVRILVTVLVFAFLAVAGFGGYWLWKDNQSFADKNSNHLVSNESDESSGEDGPLKDPVGETAEDMNSDDYSLDEAEDSPGETLDDIPGEEAEKVVINDSATEKPDPEEEKEPEEKAPEKEEPEEEVAEDESISEKEKPMIVASLITGQLKIMSDPGGATVWIDGEEVARTETPPLELQVGPVEVVLKHPRYRDTSRIVEVKEGFQLLEVPLLPDLGPVEGNSWINSIGVSFSADIPTGHITNSPVSTQLFDAFTTATGLEIPRTGQQGIAIVLSRDAMWKFCDWMTEQDRRTGYLGTDSYYRPDRIESIGGGEIFFCRIDDRFGSLLINSEPPGAKVMVNGRPYADPTPVTVSDVRLGPFEVVLKADGYAPTVVKSEKDVEGPEPIPVVASLNRDASLVYGTTWSNSLGMPMIPVGSLMVAQMETRVSDFREFVTEAGTVAMPSSGFPQALNHPVTSVTAAEARAFCDWLTLREQATGLIRRDQYYRLPTDLEWSLFAGDTDSAGDTPEERGKNGGDAFLWGAEWPPPPAAGNLADLASAGTFGQYIIEGYNDGFTATAPVGSFPAGPNGLLDLSGNVWEWVSDSYNGNGPGLGVLRGGGWDSYDPNVLRLSYRNPVPAGSRVGSYGFRFILVSVENER